MTFVQCVFERSRRSARSTSSLCQLDPPLIRCRYTFNEHETQLFLLA